MALVSLEIYTGATHWRLTQEVGGQSAASLRQELPPVVPVDFVSNQDGGTHAEYASDLCNVFCLPYKWPPTSVTAKRARRCGWTPRRDRGTAMHAPATGLIAASACHWCETMAYVLRLAHAAGRKKTRDGTAA